MNPGLRDSCKKFSQLDRSAQLLGFVMFGSLSPSSSISSLDPLMDHELLSPKTVAQEYDDIYVEDVQPDGPAILEDHVYDSKWKGKARQCNLSHYPESNVEEPGVLEVVAKQAYLSPPLTSSDNFLLGVQNISRALRNGLSSFDFDVDLDLQSGSEASSPGGRSSTFSGPEEVEEVDLTREAIVGNAESELSVEDVNESTILSASSPSEAESSRKATVGDTTLQDAGSPVLPSVRFPSIFTHDLDVSSLESSRSGSPLFPLSPVEHPGTRLEGEDPVKRSGDGIPAHRIQSVGVGVKSRGKRTSRRRRLKIQERGLSELIVLSIRQRSPKQECSLSSSRFFAHHYALLRSGMCWDSHCTAHHYGSIWTRHTRRTDGPRF